MRKLAVIMVLLLLPNIALAKGGGARASSARSSVRSSAPKTSTPKTSTPKTTTPKTTTPKVSSKPSSTTQKVTSTTNKVVGGKNFGKTGSVVGETYKPRFSGYTAPAGSVVYYERSSVMDWLPFYLILTNQQHREAVVQEPAKDGQPAKETVVKEEGVDTMYVLNWVVTILFVVLFMAFIVWLVNKKTK